MRDQISLTAMRDRLAPLFALPRWAQPERLAAEGTDPQHLRMFVLSHLCGPFIGLALSLFLLLLGFPADVRLGGFTFLVCLFWAYPAALALGARYRVMSLASLQHLTFVIFWASHSYGGLTSPFLLWLAVVPLLAFLYSAPRLKRWLVLVAMLALSTGLFAAFTRFVVPPVPADPGALRWLALVSLVSASAYVSMMAVYFGRVLSSRNEMAHEVAHRRATVTALDRRATRLRQTRAAKIASLGRLARQCRQPIDDILKSCAGEPEDGGGRSAAHVSDLQSIETAALRLRELIAGVDTFRTGFSAGTAAAEGS